jgi:hypothetical protein
VTGEYQESDDGWPSMMTVRVYELNKICDDLTSRATKILTL